MNLFRPIDTDKFKEPTEEQIKKILQQGECAGIDNISIRKLLWRSPHVLLTGISQKLYSLILFPLRAGWSSFTSQERNAMPWLCASLDWGISSAELYLNAHGLPDKHPLKNTALTAVRDMQIWEHTHPFISWLTSHSQTLNKLLGQPVLVGSDGWPLNKIDPQGNYYTEIDMYLDTCLFYHRIRPKISKRLQKLIHKITAKAITSGRLTIIQSAT